VVVVVIMIMIIMVVGVLAPYRLVGRCQRFSLDDADVVFLRNIVMNLRVSVAPKRRRRSTCDIRQQTKGEQ
jgi:hypothetical protein